MFVFNKNNGMLVDCGAMDESYIENKKGGCWYKTDKKVMKACSEAKSYFDAVFAAGEGSVILE